MADLLECLIQIKGVADTPRRLAERVRAALATGRAAEADYLRSIGAAEVIDRAQLSSPGKPLGKERWAGAVDTVGGDILFNAVKATKYGGSVACCGLTAGANFSANVFPFILRGVNLLGVDSVELPLDIKRQMWDILANEWRLPALESITQEIDLEQVAGVAERILKGGIAGRVRVRVAGN